MTCPICESPDTALVHIFNDENGPHQGRELDGVLRCTDCGLAYRDPLPTQEELDHYYQHEYRPVPPDNAEFQKYSRAMADWRVSILSSRGIWREPFTGEPYDNTFVHALPQSGDVVDVGCGVGDFVLQTSDRYFSRGIEPCAQYVDGSVNRIYDLYDDERDVDILHSSVEHWNEPRPTGVMSDGDIQMWHIRFSMVTAFHVLEHLRDPVAVLRKLGTWLEKDGRIWLEVPDYDHPLNGDVALEYHYAHLWIFTAKSLRLCMEAAGLTVCDVWNEVAPYTQRTCLFAIGRV